MLSFILPFVAIFFGTPNADAAETDRRATRTLAIGERVEAIAIEQWVRLKDKPIGALERGTVYVVDFWATWCVPCIAAMDKISSLQERYAEQGVQFVGITDEKLPTVVRFLSSVAPGEEGQKPRTQYDRARFVMGVDTDASTAAMLLPEGVRSIRPQYAIIDRDGTLAWVGLPTTGELAEILDAVLDGTWDTDAYRVEFERELALVAERDRIMAEEDWAAAKAGFWEDEDLLGRLAFAIAFGFGKPLQNPDKGVALEFATRANELKDGRNPFALHSLAKLASDRGEISEAIGLQERAVEICKTDPAAAGFLDYYSSTLEQYRRAGEAK
ncbi:MAG: TlpA family protein disulfide reductase [Phycisphaerales bacterium]